MRPLRRAQCWLCEQPGPARVFDLETQLLALGWRLVRHHGADDEWFCAECARETFALVPRAFPVLHS